MKRFSEQTKPILRILVILAILIQTFSCTDAERDNPYDYVNYRGGESSSSGGNDASSSSSEYTSSSSSVGADNNPPSSSSDTEPSSSSDAEPSSSGEEISSSSSVGADNNPPSSSSDTEPSSNSDVSSSSSSVVSPPSSSSATSSSDSGNCEGFEEGTTRMHYGKSKPQFCDERDGKKYVYVTIGSQTWMAENLNYATNGKCADELYNLTDDDLNTCRIYGRVYSWMHAMNLTGIYSQQSCNLNTCSQYISETKDICPEGWHIPSDTEWTNLTNYVETSNTCSNCAGKYLKAVDQWNDGYTNMDDYGFTALPGGSGTGSSSTSFLSSYGESGYWWVATENNATNAYNRRMQYDKNEVTTNKSSVKTSYLSVRCIKDNN